MGYNERRAFEQKLTARIQAGIKNDDDVKRVASELSKANVKMAQQAQEIEHLKKALKSSAQDENTAQTGAKKAKAQVSKHEQKISQQAAEIATLREEITAGKLKEEELQNEVDAVRRGQWWQV